MVWPFSSKKDVIDLTERYRRQQEKAAAIRAEKQSQAQSSGGGFSFFDNPVSNTQSIDSDIVNVDADERKRKLAKRLQNIT